MNAMLLTEIPEVSELTVQAGRWAGRENLFQVVYLAKLQGYLHQSPEFPQVKSNVSRW